MPKRMLVIGCALVFIGLVTGCGDKVDEEELYEAQQLVTGINMMAMMTNVDAYGTSADGTCGAPEGWDGPFVIELPEGSDTLFYEYTFPFWWFPRPHIDTSGVFVDSIRWLAMPEPDVWEDSTLVCTGINTWLIGQTYDYIYFHTTFSVADSLVVTGDFKWNWDETWYKYEYEVSKFTEAADIDITTSTNIGLAAHFLFVDNGSGTEEDCYAEWNNTIFVKYVFFAEPDPENNNADGYYTLLSEAWKVRHYFWLVKYEEPVD
jgi:hypothetical protein